jgi:PleD family two-component response regulator
MALILIVDDECPDRRGVTKALADEGYRMLSIDDPDVIWAYINRFKPDLVLLNGLSERFQSFEVLNDIKKKSPEFPVLVYMVKDGDALKKLKQAIAFALFEVRFSREKKGHLRSDSWDLGNSAQVFSHNS